MALLSFVIHSVPLGQHAPMQDAGDEDSFGDFPVKDHMAALLDSPQSCAKLLAGTPQQGIVSNASAALSYFAQITGRLRWTPGVKSIGADIQDVRFRAEREINVRQAYLLS
jgi:hypothetical protein